MEKKKAAAKKEVPAAKTKQRKKVKQLKFNCSEQKILSPAIAGFFIIESPPVLSNDK